MNGTIFMIHGMWGGGWYWDNYKAYFEEKGYRCMTPYLRHHQIGPDDPAPDGLGETSLLDYAKDLEAEISTLPDKPILMGHSMGGLLAQILASRGCAKSAVLITPAAPAWIFSIRWSVLRSFSGVLFKKGFWKKPHKLSYKSAVYAMMSKLPEQEGRTIYNRGVWESGRAAAEIGLWPLGFKGAGVKRKHVKCPVLAVAGAEDKITPATVVRKIARKYRPFSTYMEFAGHAHWILKEPGWEKVAEHISLWLDQHLTDS
jgi:pimeloyl-ACP methyl ester carboxylesterase